MVAGIHGCMDSWLHGFMVARIPGCTDSWLQGFMVAWTNTQGCTLCICSFANSFVRKFVHSTTRSSVHPFTRSSVRPFTRSFNHPFIQPSVHPPIRSFPRPPPPRPLPHPIIPPARESVYHMPPQSIIIQKRLANRILLTFAVHKNTLLSLRSTWNIFNFDHDRCF